MLKHEGTFEFLLVGETIGVRFRACYFDADKKRRRYSSPAEFLLMAGQQNERTTVCPTGVVKPVPPAQ